MCAYIFCSMEFRCFKPIKILCICNHLNAFFFFKIINNLIFNCNWEFQKIIFNFCYKIIEIETRLFNLLQELIDFK